MARLSDHRRHAGLLSQCGVEVEIAARPEGDQRVPPGFEGAVAVLSNLVVGARLSHSRADLCHYFRVTGGRTSQVFKVKSGSISGNQCHRGNRRRALGPRRTAVRDPVARRQARGSRCSSQSASEAGIDLLGGGNELVMTDVDLITCVHQRVLFVEVL